MIVGPVSIGGICTIEGGLSHARAGEYLYICSWPIKIHGRDPAVGLGRVAERSRTLRGLRPLSRMTTLPKPSLSKTGQVTVVLGSQWGDEGKGSWAVMGVVLTNREAHRHPCRRDGHLCTVRWREQRWSHHRCQHWP